MELLEKLKHRFKYAGIVEKLIYINLAVFIFVFIIRIFSPLLQFNSNILVNWFALPANFNEFIHKPWTIITYGFLHVRFSHILFNLIALYFIGHLFKQYFTSKQLLNFYLLGTIFGGLIFMICYNTFPFFKNDINNSILLGASAGVSAILVGIAAYIPKYAFKVPLIGYIKLWYIAVFSVGLDILQFFGNNAGGHIAHIGGALFGFFYVTYASNKKITFFNPFQNTFKKKEKPLKTVYKSGKKKTSKITTKSENQAEIDAILDKISKSGYDTLSKTEKDFLFKQGKK